MNGRLNRRETIMNEEEFADGLSCTIFDHQAERPGSWADNIADVQNKSDVYLSDDTGRVFTTETGERFIVTVQKV
jgi:hypothetical protein